MIKTLGFVIVFFFQTVVFSQTRVLEMEFDQVEDASLYEFEFRIQGESKLIKVLSLKNPMVEMELPYNHYEFRQRTRDQRKVPGPWSAWEKFTVTVPEIKITNPAEKMRIETDSFDFEKISINWNPNPGIATYQITAMDIRTNQEVLTQISRTNQVELELPVASEYKVSVKTILDENVASDLEQTASVQFSVIAEALEKPDIISVKSEYSRKISWEKNNLAESYQVLLERYDRVQKRWRPLMVANDFKGTELKFNPQWGGGQYRLKVGAKAPFRKQSDFEVDNFELASVRTPAAEYNASVTKSIDRINGFYAQASWLITQFSMSSLVHESHTTTRVKPLGGTLRVGTGYFKSNYSWGFSGFLNSSHVILNDQNKAFNSLDLNALYRYKFTYRDELRLSLGLSHKELPVLYGDEQMNQSGFHKANVSGPRLAMEYWYSLGPQVGLQMNYSQNFYSFFENQSAPNGRRVKVPTSFQLGMMMSYKFNDTVTALIGVTHQEESYEYEATERSGADPIVAGTLNNGFLKADYIGLMVEIGL
ncbi:MAG: hypothetical protein A3D17_01010 [Bdellovibrionales bacterium RIFCSPHIGHO2_02_FULL_40_15]|nr:MAG: hypothetical protein A3D17_01010 [Bdellovibrionales bacterium RIFCSPHIGHO2_02_FULL_40_15]